jgi:hypothetical protein
MELIRAENGLLFAAKSVCIVGLQQWNEGRVPDFDPLTFRDAIITVASSDLGDSFLDMLTLEEPCADLVVRLDGLERVSVSVRDAHHAFRLYCSEHPEGVPLLEEVQRKYLIFVSHPQGN